MNDTELHLPPLKLLQPIHCLYVTRQRIYGSARLCISSISGGHTIVLSTHVCIDMNNFNWLDGWQLEMLDNKAGYRMVTNYPSNNFISLL